MSNKKAVILARVSTLKQEKEGLSLKDIIKAINRIIEVFSNPIEIEIVKIGWEEIKKTSYQTTSITDFSLPR